MEISNIIIPNPEYRRKYKKVLDKNSIGNQNPLSIVALEAAYNKSEDWLDQLLNYLEENIDFIHKYLAENLPKAKLINPQATYLGWLDFREYERSGKKLENFVYHKGKVALDGGTWFGNGGDGFLRINFACPRSLLKEGLKRICTVIKEEYD
jgi:cystathionine beta-lyase